MKAKKGDRWALIAAAGGGKTTAEQAIAVPLIRAWPKDPVYVIDSKHEKAFDSWWNLKGVSRWDKSEAPVPVKKGIQIWRPVEDIRDEYNQFLKAIFTRRKPCIIIIDELSSLGGESEASSYPRYLRIILKQGRSLGITIMIGSQEASYVPRQLLGQTNRVLTGHLNLPADKSKMAEYYGFGKKSEDWHIPDAHGFWFVDPTVPLDRQPPVYYRDIQEFLGL